ncbi:hypothetical protein Aazo_2366 ['Nostoc azollae' 0708]|jgi:hypothetical protein|uniref:Uncharacterized protein n=1 Tax=Nostoc azollae (strain 0708) TaxID=551115 RepID=D7DXY6_NOSA0|nr:hypothetical protein Aazo_2366 ['Nostoc azollae' 0708]
MVIELMVSSIASVVTRSVIPTMIDFIIIYTSTSPITSNMSSRMTTTIIMICISVFKNTQQRHSRYHCSENNRSNWFHEDNLKSLVMISRSVGRKFNKRRLHQALNRFNQQMFQNYSILRILFNSLTD